MPVRFSAVFIALTSIEVTNNKDFTFDMDGIREFVRNFHLYSLVLLLEIVLRFLKIGNIWLFIECYIF